MASARDNIKEPPGIFIKNSLDSLKGTLRFVENDLPKAFLDVDDLGLLGDLADAQTEAIDALNVYIDYVETDLAPKARSSFRLGAERFGRKLRLDDGIDLPVDKLLDIGAARVVEDAGRIPPRGVARRARRSGRGLAQGQDAPLRGRRSRGHGDCDR